MVIQAGADDWAKFADTYKRLVETSTREPTQKLLEALNKALPFYEGIGFLDNGSGPGTILTRLINEHGSSIPSSCSLTCSDFSLPMIEKILETRKEILAQDPHSIWRRVEAIKLDALNLINIKDCSQSHVAAGLLYNLTTDPMRCLSECRRVLHDGGVLALSAWEGNEWLEMMQVLPIIKPELANATSAKWSDADAMTADLVSAGFHDVVVESVPIHVAYESYDSFVDTLLTYQPRLVGLQRELNDEQIVSLKRLLKEEMKVYCQTEPGTLNGRVLVGVGRK